MSKLSLAPVSSVPTCSKSNFIDTLSYSGHSLKKILKNSESLRRQPLAGLKTDSDESVFSFF